MYLQFLIFLSNHVFSKNTGPLGGMVPPLSVALPANSGTPEQSAVILKVIILLTVLGLAPSILIMTTSFIRIVITLSFLRQALGTQTLPPNQLVVALSLFLTAFVMAPTWKGLYSEGLEPYFNNKLSQEKALETVEGYLRQFMFKQTRDKDLGLFLKLAKIQNPKTRSDVPTYLLIPAFMISELKTAFQIGFMIYVPFLVLDMVIASVLTAMGMMMLPPSVISLPFKLILFVLVDGWGLIVGSLVKSFG